MTEELSRYQLLRQAGSLTYQQKPEARNLQEFHGYMKSMKKAVSGRWVNKKKGKRNAPSTY